MINIGRSSVTSLSHGLWPGRVELRKLSPPLSHFWSECSSQQQEGKMDSISLHSNIHTFSKQTSELLFMYPLCDGPTKVKSQSPCSYQNKYIQLQVPMWKGSSDLRRHGKIQTTHKSTKWNKWTAEVTEPTITIETQKELFQWGRW